MAALPRPVAPSASVRCSASARSYNITLLPGDGIGPEVVAVAKDVLSLAVSLEGVELSFQEKLMGGSALAVTGVPLPEETLAAARDSDAVLLGAIGGYKWDNNEKHLKPETGLLQLRAGLGVFANLRPAAVLPQLVDASTLKREVAEGVDIMVVRELTGGIYFGKPRGFGTNNKGEDTGFNTEIYSVPEIDRIARLAFEVALKRGGKLCSVDKANVLERPNACSWFMWEDEYYKFLVENGFLDDFHTGAGNGVTQGPVMEQPDARDGVTQAVEELQRRVGQMETEIAELKQQQQLVRSRNPESGDLVFIVVCLNVVVVVVALIVAMLK